MLHLFIGGLDRKDMYTLYTYAPNKAFDSEFETSWFDDDICERIVRVIDKTEHIKGNLFESSVLGPISALQLSTGVKTLILMYKRPEYAVNGECLGDNCWQFLNELGDKVDCTVCIDHSPLHSEHMPKNWSFILDNTGDYYELDEEGYFWLYRSISKKTNAWMYDENGDWKDDMPDTPTVEEFYGKKPNINSPAAKYTKNLPTSEELDKLFKDD